MRAKDIMTTPVVTVDPMMSPKELSALLVAKGISAVPVVDEQEELVGIVSEADLIGLEGAAPTSAVRPLAGRSRAPATVAEIMTRDVVVLPESADVAEVAKLMLDLGVKRIPIVHGSRVVGIVSRRDVLRVLARSDEEIHAHLAKVLADEAATLGQFRASVVEGTVTLSGPRDASARRLATLLARSIPGVIAVRFENA